MVNKTSSNQTKQIKRQRTHKTPIKKSLKRNSTPFSTNIEHDTLKNTDWRHVIFTSKHMQVTLMNVPPNEELEWEIHKDTDQFFRIEEGQGLLQTKPSITSKVSNNIKLKNGIAAVVPQGIYHNVINTSKTKALKLYSIYTPPHHNPIVIDRTHQDEKMRELNLN